MVVVFPDPFGPRNPKTPPDGTARSRSSIARVRERTRRLNVFRRPATSIALGRNGL
jgi:hypothetical protein